MQMVYHRHIVLALHGMHAEGESGDAASDWPWLLRVDAQAYDMRLYSNERRVELADKALLAGNILMSQLHQVHGHVTEPTHPISAT